MVSVPPGRLGRATIDYRLAYSRDKISLRDWKQCVLANQCQPLGAMASAGPEPAAASWLDIQQYLTWLSLETGHDYRLLSETEWEYVAKSAALGVDSLEWTSDCWHPDRVAAPLDGSSWTRKAIAATTSRAGGARGDLHHHALSVLVHATDPALGFRVARTL
jgi:formylglycine-generating enzyme required for sulfatase activity